MGSYVMLANWTDQGARAIGDAPRRIDAARKVLEDMGGKFECLYLTMGDYDLVGVFDAPDDALAARFLLLLGKTGTVRTRSMRAFPEAAFRELIHSVG